MKKTFFPLLLCLLLSCQGCTSKTSDSVPELLEPSDSERTTVSVIRDDFSDREVYEGFVAPETTDLSFELDGTIQSILVSSGQYVNEGDSLVTLDITEEEQRISDLNAELEDLRAELAYTESLYTNRTEYLKAELKQIIEQEGYGTNYQLKRIDIDEYDLDYYQTTKDLNNQISADEQALSDLEAVAVKATLTAPHSGYFYLSSDLAENSYLTKGKNVCSITREDSLCFLSSYLDEADVKNASLSVLLHGNSYSVSYDLHFPLQMNATAPVLPFRTTPIFLLCRPATPVFLSQTATVWNRFFRFPSTRCSLILPDPMSILWKMERRSARMSQPVQTTAL